MELHPGYRRPIPLVEAMPLSRQAGLQPCGLQTLCATRTSVSDGQRFRRWITTGNVPVR